jgi:hypothetical protein
MVAIAKTDRDVLAYKPRTGLRVEGDDLERTLASDATRTLIGHSLDGRPGPTTPPAGMRLLPSPATSDNSTPKHPAATSDIGRAVAFYGYGAAAAVAGCLRNVERGGLNARPRECG